MLTEPEVVTGRGVEGRWRWVELLPGVGLEGGERVRRSRSSVMRRLHARAGAELR